MATVSLTRATSYDLSQLRSSLESLLEPLGGMKQFVNPGDRVLLKPNLLTGNRPQKECITRPEIAYCVAQLVQEAGGKPFLGDSPAFGSAKGVARNNGYLPLMEALNVPIVEFKGKRYDIISDTFDHLRLSKEVMDADVVINLPKVKSHAQLTITLGVKNLFGCVPGKMKAWWHMEAGKDAEHFATMLIETARTIAPNLTIMDGIIGHEGNGPSGGEPRDLGILGASNDVFNLDRVFVDLLNVSPQQVPTVATAIRLGLCGDLDQIDFPLLHPNELRVDDWKLPDRLMPIDFGLPRVIRSTARHFLRLLQEYKTA
jgi:uncharacterized protein (DUF362 family)